MTERNTDRDSYWKKRFENERAKRSSECYSCGFSIIFDSDRTTYDTKQVAHAVFRCWECGRLFCSDCAKTHFGFGRNDRSVGTGSKQEGDE